MNIIRLIFFVAMFCCVTEIRAQFTISGMVVDSVTLDPLSGVAVKFKILPGGVVTNDQGFFTIILPSYDTLLFSRIGYQDHVYPVSGSERDIMFLLREDVKVLKEVVVDFYREEKIIHAAPRQIRTLTVGDALISPFTYFSKTEKEKRMLVRLQAEQQKIQVYLDLVTRPRFKADLMETFSISENIYYELLVKFNTENRDTHYLQNESEIKKNITDFFQHQLNSADQN